MKPIKLLWPSLAMLASFLAVGIPYWRIPYQGLTLPNALLTPWLLVAVLAALLLCTGRALAFLWVVPMITLSVVAVVMVRVAMDTAHDPTSHNLWPVEAIIALAIGFSAAFVGALPGTLIALAKGSRAVKP